jgi:hypothetical protein
MFVMKNYLIVEQITFTLFITKKIRFIFFKQSDETHPGIKVLPQMNEFIY